MRYNVAIKALLRKMGEGRNVLATETPPSLLSQLSLSTFKHCRDLSLSWQCALVSSADGCDDGVSHAHTHFDELRSRSPQHTISDQIPALLLLLEISDQYHCPHKFDRTHNQLLVSLLCNIPRSTNSLLLYGLFRSLLLCLLPNDLRTITTASLFAFFVSLSVIKDINECDEEDSSKVNARRTPRYLPTAVRQSTEITTVIAEMPPRLRRHFTIQDDQPVLKRIVEEFARRLPAAGDSIPGDYLKTLIEGHTGARGTHVTVEQSYTFSFMMAESSSQRVTREEFAIFMAKLAPLEGRIEKHRIWKENATRNRDDKLPRRTKHSECVSAAVVAATTSALSSLCLIKNIAEVVAARELTMNEWMMLFACGACDVPSWREVTLPALRTALHMSEAQRVERNAERRVYKAAEDTIFPHIPLPRRVWIIRGILASLFEHRRSYEDLCEVFSACTPLWWEYVRLLRRHAEIAPHEAIRAFGVSQGLWVVTRVLWTIDQTKATEQKEYRRNHDAHDRIDGCNGDSDAAASSSAPPRSPARTALTELKQSEMLQVIEAIIDAVGDLTQRSEDRRLPPPAALPPATPLASQAEAGTAAKPRRGAGFARTARPPPETSASHSGNRMTDDKTAESASFFVELLLEARLAHTYIMLESGDATEGRLDKAMMVALRTLPTAVAAAAAELERLRGSATSFLDSTNSATVCRNSRDQHHQAGAPRLPPLFFRQVDFIMHQIPVILRVIGDLLEFSGEHALSAEQRAAVFAALTETTNAMCTFFQVMMDTQVMKIRTERPLQSLLTLYSTYVQPSLESSAGVPADMMKLFCENRQAMARLSRMGLETVNLLWSSSPAFSSSSLRGAGTAPETASTRLQIQVTMVRVANFCMLIGRSVGLTSEDLPHLTSTLRRGLETLTACAKLHGSSGRSGSNNNALQDILLESKVLSVWVNFTICMCIVGVHDEDSLAAAGEALRYCGVDGNIESMTQWQRLRFLGTITAIFRALGPRYTASRECRHFLHQLLALAARMAKERVRFKNVHRNSSAADKERAISLCGQCVALWQITCIALTCTVPLAAVDKNINTILQYVKRNLALAAEGLASSLPSTSFSDDVARLERCEAMLRRSPPGLRTFYRMRVPETLDDVLQCCNDTMHIFVECAKHPYRQIISELHNTPSNASRLRWQAHMETYSTVVLRFQGQIAPSLWQRIAQDSVKIQTILSYSNMVTLPMEEALIVSIENVLLFSEAHSNTGQWYSSVVDNRSSERRSEKKSMPEFLYELAKTQLIPYHRVVRYLAFQDRLRNMDRRAYLVELADRLTVEVVEVERRNEVPLFPVHLTSLLQDGHKEVHTTVVKAGRAYLVGAFRRMRL
jgi:hypothetical protein